MTTASNMRATTLWIMLLTLASTAATYLLACATPYVALAALAATHMRRRDGIALMLAVWVASQAVGFGVLGYPHDPSTIVWGAGLGAAAIAAVAAARFATQRAPKLAVPTRLALAFVTALLAFKAVLLLWALQLGGVAITLSPTYTAQQVVRDGAFLIGLYAFYRLLVWSGLPAAPPARPANA